MKKLIIGLVAIAAVLMQSCMSTQSVSQTTYTSPQPKVVNLALVKDAPSNRFVNLDYGIRLNVKDDRANYNILKKYDASTTSTPKVNVDPDVNSFVSESMRRYMRTMGFKLDADVSTGMARQL